MKLMCFSLCHCYVLSVMVFLFDSDVVNYVSSVASGSWDVLLVLFGTADTGSLFGRVWKTTLLSLIIEPAQS